jgi:phosphonate transport system permease protein
LPPERLACALVDRFSSTVGTGEISFLINESIKLFRFDEMLTHILVVLALVVMVDNVSALVRKRIQ